MASVMEKQNVAEAQSETLKLQIKRIIHAPRSHVFDAWTEPEMLQRWFGPGNMTVASATTDTRTGGAYRIEMQGVPTCDDAAAADPEVNPRDTSRKAVATGVYQEIIPDELLRFTWRGDWEPDEETLVTVTLRDVPGGTELTLTHERFATEKSMGGHEQGWNSSLDKLAAYCEDRSI